MASIGSRKDVKNGTTYYIDYRVDGKRRRVQIGGSRKEAEGVLREIKRRLAARDPVLSAKERMKDLPLPDWWKEYLEWARGHKGESGCERDERIIRDMGEYLAGQGVASLKQVQHRHLSRYLLLVWERSRIGTANRYQHTPKKAFSLAAEYGHLAVNPATRIKEFRESATKPPRFFSVEELRQILWASVLVDPDFYRCVLFLVSRGRGVGKRKPSHGGM